MSEWNDDADIYFCLPFLTRFKQIKKKSCVKLVNLVLGISQNYAIYSSRDSKYVICILLTFWAETQKYNLRTGTRSSVYTISRQGRMRWFFGDAKYSDGLLFEPPNFRFPKCCMRCMISAGCLLSTHFTTGTKWTARSLYLSVLRVPVLLLL